MGMLVGMLGEDLERGSLGPSGVEPPLAQMAQRRPSRSATHGGHHEDQ